MNKENRRMQREEALKLLYAMNMRDIYTEDFINSYIEYNNLNKSSFPYLYELLLEYLDNMDEIEKIINSQAENYKFNRIPLIDKCIVRLALTEIFNLKIPHSVSINEAVELSKIYSNTDSYKLVNSILGKIVRGFNDRI